jgi:hypothetical protein
VQHSIIRALASNGLSVRDAASALGVDPKTIQRWCAGRIPYRSNRAALSRLTGWPEHDLWPTVVKPLNLGVEGSAVRLIYPHLSLISDQQWRAFFRRAVRCIDVLHWASLPVEGAYIAEICRESPPRVTRRVLLSGIDLMDADSSMRLRNVFEGVPYRLGTVSEYTAIYRVDDDIMISPLVIGCQPGGSPVFEVNLNSQFDLGGMYMSSFQQSWDRGR